MAEYEVLSENEKDDIIVAFVLAQERDKYCHELNLQRYIAMLEKLEPGEWRARIEKLKNETEQRLAEVNSILEATKNQIPPPGRIEAARQRLKAASAWPT